MKGAQRSVTPEAFSAGTTAKVSSGYLPFQSCAEAVEAENASAAAPAKTMRRLIMVCPLVVVTLFRPFAGLQAAALLLEKAQAAAAVPSSGTVASSGADAG